MLPPRLVRRVMALLASGSLLVAGLVIPAASAQAGVPPVGGSAVQAGPEAGPRATDVWDRLRAGRGYAILLRHALAPGTGDPPGFRLGDCSTQRNLSSEGRRQAIAIGAQWRRQRVPVTGVLTSRWCRARDTARLLAVGRVTAYPDFDSSFTATSAESQRRTRLVRERIAQHRGQSGVLVLIGHQVNITALTGVFPDSGSGVVVAATRDGDLRVVGILPAP